jgi:hypothetical protein
LVGDANSLGPHGMPEIYYFLPFGSHLLVCPLNYTIEERIATRKISNFLVKNPNVSRETI